MKCKLHAFGIATCRSESYAGQNPTQQASSTDVDPKLFHFKKHRKYTCVPKLEGWPLNEWQSIKYKFQSFCHVMMMSLNGVLDFAF